MIRRRRTMADETRVATWEIVGAMLRYPDSALIEALPAIASAARDAQIPSAEQVAALAEQWQDNDIGQLQRTYVERFDLGRACSLDQPLDFGSLARRRRRTHGCPH